MKKIPKQLAKTKSEISKLQNAAYENLDSELSSVYKASLDDILGQLEAWVENYDLMTFSKKREFERRLQSAEAINRALGGVAGAVNGKVQDYLIGTGMRQYQGTFYQMETTYGLSLNNFKPDLDQVRQIVDKPVAGHRLSTRLYTDTGKLAKRTNQAILSGLWNGDGYNKIAGHVSRLSEASYKNAKRIARTEGGRISDDMNYQAYKQAEKQGIGIQKRWLAALDSRTRTNHRRLDGQTIGLDDEFEIDGNKTLMPHHFGVASEDIHCRCTTISIVDGIEPTERRDNESGDPASAKNYAEWLGRKEQLLEAEKSAGEYGADIRYVKSKSFKEKLEAHPVTKKLASAIQTSAVQMLRHRNGTTFEDMAIIDKVTGSIVASYGGSRKKKVIDGYPPSFKKVFSSGHRNRYITVHNHPSSSPPSTADLLAIRKRHGDATTHGIIVGHDGTIYLYSKPMRRDIDPNDFEQDFISISGHEYIGSNIERHFNALRKLGKIYGFTVEQL